MFMSDISIIVRKMRIAAERSQSTSGVGFPEQLVLMCLKAHGSSNQERIAAFLDIDKGAIAKTIAKLEKKQLVAREANPNNRRENKVVLQPAAEDVLAELHDSYTEFENTLFAGFSAEEIKQLEHLIALAAHNVSEI